MLKGGLIIYLHNNFQFEPKLTLTTCRLLEGQVKLVKKGRTLGQYIHIALKFRPPSETLESFN